VVSSTPWPHFTPGKELVPILHEAGWVSGPVWTGGKSRPNQDSILDRTTVVFIGFISQLVAVRLNLPRIYPSICPSVQPKTKVAEVVLVGVHLHNPANTSKNCTRENRKKGVIGNKNNLLHDKISHSSRRGERKERKKFN